MSDVCFEVGCIEIRGRGNDLATICTARVEI
jgi:hypothetical protein